MEKDKMIKEWLVDLRNSLSDDDYYRVTDEFLEACENEDAEWED